MYKQRHLAARYGRVAGSGTHVMSQRVRIQSIKARSSVVLVTGSNSSHTLNVEDPQYLVCEGVGIYEHAID